jgi:hypothetical protein
MYLRYVGRKAFDIAQTTFDLRTGRNREGGRRVKSFVMRLGLSGLGAEGRSNAGLPCYDARRTSTIPESGSTMLIHPKHYQPTYKYTWRYNLNHINHTKFTKSRSFLNANCKLCISRMSGQHILVFVL